MLPELDRPVHTLRGVGEKREALLQEVGVCTVADLLLFLPYRYIDRTCERGIVELPLEREVTAVGRVRSLDVIPGKRRRFVMVLEDDSGELECVWFAGFQYFKGAFAEGDLLALGGKITRFQGRGHADRVGQGQLFQWQADGDPRI